MQTAIDDKANEQYIKYVTSSLSPTCVRWFLFTNLLPATFKRLVIEKCGAPKLFANYKNKRVRVVMASRFGDVGITENLTTNHGYSSRVYMDELSNFSDKE